MPLDYAAALDKATQERGFTSIQLIAPNGTDERLSQITAKARGLIYAVARSGVTGADSDFGGIASFIQRIRARTEVPIAVGFGVRRPADIACLKGIADLAVVGSASLQAFQEGGESRFRAFWAAMASASH